VDDVEGANRPVLPSVPVRAGPVDTQCVPAGPDLPCATTWTGSFSKLRAKGRTEQIPSHMWFRSRSAEDVLIFTSTSAH
jgi:hypothetical protein